MKRIFFVIMALCVAYMAYANFQAASAVLDEVIDTFFVKQNIKKIAQLVGQEYFLNKTLPSDLPEFIRENLSTKSGNVKRDPALDWWGTLYALKTVGGQPAVASAGPDKKFGTIDDVVASVSFQGESMGGSAVSSTAADMEKLTSSLSSGSLSSSSKRSTSSSASSSSTSKSTSRSRTPTRSKKRSRKRRSKKKKFFGRSL